MSVNTGKFITVDAFYPPPPLLPVMASRDWLDTAGWPGWQPMVGCQMWPNLATTSHRKTFIE